MTSTDDNTRRLRRCTSALVGALARRGRRRWRGRGRARGASLTDGGKQHRRPPGARASASRCSRRRRAPRASSSAYAERQAAAGQAGRPRARSRRSRSRRRSRRSCARHRARRTRATSPTCAGSTTTSVRALVRAGARRRAAARDRRARASRRAARTRRSSTDDDAALDARRSRAQFAKAGGPEGRGRIAQPTIHREDLLVPEPLIQKYRRARASSAARSRRRTAARRWAT